MENLFVCLLSYNEKHLQNQRTFQRNQYREYTTDSEDEMKTGEADELKK